MHVDLHFDMYRALRWWFSFSAIIDYLENYAIGETPHVSIRRAVDEAKKILADLKRRNHRQADIAARYCKSSFTVYLANMHECIQKIVQEAVIFL